MKLELPPIDNAFGLFENHDPTASHRLFSMAQQYVSAHPKTRIAKIVDQQQTFWIKQSQQTRFRVWHWLSAAAAVATRNPLLKPTVETGGPEALKAESERLKRLAALGISVPQVVAEGNGWFMLNDIGRPLSDWLRDANVSREDKRKIVRCASEHLALLHSQGLWHGRPAFRDMAFDGESFGFLDFEEDPARTLTPAQCLMRDALLYMHSLHRYLDNDRELIEEGIEHYRKLAPKSIFLNACEFAKSLWFIYGLLSVLQRYLGKDAKYAYQTLKTLRNDSIDFD